MGKKKDDPYPVPNPKELYDEANYFIKASEFIEKEAGIISLKQTINVGTPLYTIAKFNHAFAVELYLKCVMAIENGEAWKGHNFKFLFSKISEPNRNKIIAYHDNSTFHNSFFVHTFKMKTKFEELLEDASNAFEDHRYWFQNKNRKPYDMDYAIKAIERVILEMRPDFKT